MTATAQATATVELAAGPEADLALRGPGRVVADFLEALPRPAIPDLGPTAGPSRDPAGSAQVRRRRPVRRASARLPPGRDTGAYALLPFDQPAVLASELRAFIAA
jgi:hypothetical protein